MWQVVDIIIIIIVIYVYSRRGTQITQLMPQNASYNNASTKYQSSSSPALMDNHCIKSLSLVLPVQGQRARLGDQILVDRNALAALLAVSGLLDAAERRLRGGRVAYACQHKT